MVSPAPATYILPQKVTSEFSSNTQSIQGGAKVGLPLFVGKNNTLINNYIRINSVFHVLTTINLLLPYLVLFAVQLSPEK